jgi:hypothetical protein
MAQKQQKYKSRGLKRNRHGPVATEVQKRRPHEDRHGPEATEVQKQRPHEEQIWPRSNRGTKAEAS